MNTNLIRCVIATLNDVEVKGKDNLDKLLGSIMALEKHVQDLVQILEATKQETKEDANG